MEKNILSYYENKKILVTGGSGAIGSNLVRELLENNATVIVLDDLSSGHKWLLPKHNNLRLVIGSVLDEEKLKFVFSSKPDIVFHLAAHFANQNSVEHPETDLRVNGLGTLKILEYAMLADVNKVIFASSGCSVYGSDAPLPFYEEQPVSIELDTPYQIHKLLGELYCNYFYHYYKLPVVRVRYFNVYGPGEVPGKYRNVIPNFIYLALNKQKLPITGTGEETRDFTFVKDIVQGTLLAGAIKEAIGDAFNLASGTETKIIDLAQKINELTKNPAGIQFKEKRRWDRSNRRRASIKKAQKILGYNPTVSIDEGLKQTVQWFIKNWDIIKKYATFNEP